MRSVRALLFLLLVLAGLTACDSKDEQTNGSVQSGGTSSDVGSPASQTTPDASFSGSTSQNMEIPAVSGKWKARGDLCKIVTGKVAGEALGFPMEASSVSVSGMAATGIDACNYVYDDTSSGKIYVAQAQVLRADKSVVDRTVRELVAMKYEVQTFNVPGVDTAFYGHREGFVYGNGIMTVAHNGATGAFDPAALVRFTVLVHKVMTNS